MAAQAPSTTRQRAPAQAAQTRAAQARAAQARAQEQEQPQAQAQAVRLARGVSIVTPGVVVLAAVVLLSR